MQFPQEITTTNQRPGIVIWSSKQVILVEWEKRVWKKGSQIPGSSSRLSSKRMEDGRYDAFQWRCESLVPPEQRGRSWPDVCAGRQKWLHYGCGGNERSCRKCNTSKTYCVWSFLRNIPTDCSHCRLSDSWVFPGWDLIIPVGVLKRSRKINICVYIQKFVHILCV